MATKATIVPVPCKICGRLPGIWVEDNYVLRYKKNKDTGEMREFIDSGRRTKYKIRCMGRMSADKSKVCHSSVFIRTNLDKVIADWNKHNSIGDLESNEEKSHGEEK